MMVPSGVKISDVVITLRYTNLFWDEQTFGNRG